MVVGILWQKKPHKNQATYNEDFKLSLAIILPKLLQRKRCLNLKLAATPR
jgi:hypothetical protein